MIPWLLFLLPVTFALDIEKTHGVPPSRLSQYKPLTGNTWKCVNASKEIPWSAVNDDYCDCPDGSDEPGQLPSHAIYTKEINFIWNQGPEHV